GARATRPRRHTRGRRAGGRNHEPLAQPQPHAIAPELIGGDECPDGHAVPSRERAEGVAARDLMDAVGGGIRRNRDRGGEQRHPERTREERARGRNGAGPARKSKPAKTHDEGNRYQLTASTYDADT